MHYWEETTEVKCHSYHIISRAHAVNITCHSWCWPWSPGSGSVCHISALENYPFHIILLESCCNSLRVMYLHKSFGIFLHGKFVYFMHLFLHSNKCVCVCGVCNVCVHMLAQLYLTLCDPMKCGRPGSSVHGISQARILEWVAISYFRGTFQPRDQIHISCISYSCRQIFYLWATWEVPCISTDLSIF